MSYRDHRKGGNLFSAIEHQQGIAVSGGGILKLKEIIDWEIFRPILEEVTGYSQRDWSRGGRLPYEPMLMFKMLVVQKFHGLSDEATEYQVRDRLSFQQFLGVELGDDIPDANTLWDFRELIEKDGRDGAAKLFSAFHSVLEEGGLLAREGSIVDASFVEAPRQHNSREENEKIKGGERPEGFEKDTAKGCQKDCEARWTKKNSTSYYGYKNHAKVDAKTKFIDRAKTTPAQVHDSQVFKQLVDEEDNAVLADSAYYSEEHELYLLEECDCEEFLMRKARRGNPLSESEVATNRGISRIRVRVEHVFGRMKQMGADVVRSIGLRRATQHNDLCNLVYNLDRYAYLRRSAR